MKKVFIPSIFIIFLGILSFIVFTKADIPTLTKEEAIILGEEKYLLFLWMVDGAFNSERMDGDYIVNGKELLEEEKIFKCIYKKKKDKTCVGENFEKEFSKLFSSKYQYSDIYGDGLGYNWYSYENGKYIFNNLDNCNVNRMPKEQKLELVNIKSDELEYKVIYTNQQNKVENTRTFILVKEDDEWKINRAFYYDMCEIKYYIY